MNWDKWIPALRNLRILENNTKKVSLSNVAVIVILVKLAISPFDWAAASALLFSLISYQGAKVINKKLELPSDLENQVTEIKEKLSKQESQVTALSVQSGLKGLR